MTMKFPAVLAASVLLLSGCAASTPTAETDAPNVITAFYPLEWVTTQVMGSSDGVSTLTAPGAEPHDLELTPKQIASLSDADLIVYVKGLQPAVDEAVEQSGAKNVLEVGSVVELLPAAEEHEHDAEEGKDHDHEAEEGHSEEEHDDHDHGAFDPHFWQDPTRMATLAKAIETKLSDIDSSRAADFQSNSEKVVSELGTLDQEFTAGLASCSRSEFITTHAAFNYLAERYGLEEIGISGINPDAEPSPARIAEIHKEAKAHGVTTIFFETLTSPAVAEAIAGDLQLKTAVLDPLEGVTENSPGEDYPSIMRANLEALRSANDCK